MMIITKAEKTLSQFRVLISSAKQHKKCEKGCGKKVEEVESRVPTVHLTQTTNMLHTEEELTDANNLCLKSRFVTFHHTKYLSVLYSTKCRFFI